MFNMNDLISIIVPVYNVEKYLDKCIESIVNQTYTSLEIILIDDGSSDNCPAICDNWAEKDNRIKVIHKSNGGLSDARNCGIAASTGKHIAFVDSDDYIEPDMYEKLSKTMLSTASDVVFCKHRSVYENEQYAVSSADSYDITEYAPQDAMSALIDDKIRQVVWNKLYKAELIKDTPFDVGKCHEDEFWSYKIIGKSSKTTGIDYTGYNYLQRENSIMNNNYTMKRFDAVEAKILRQKYLDSKYPELSQKGRINLIFTCIYHGQLSLKNFSQSEQKLAFSFLKKPVKEHIDKLDFTFLTTKEKLWFTLAKFSLKLCCALRNMINIGF